MLLRGPSRPKNVAFTYGLAATLLLIPLSSRLSLAASVSHGVATSSTVAAYVNKTAITDAALTERTAVYSFLIPSEASQFVQPQLQSLILQRLIQETLVLQAADRGHVGLQLGKYAAQAQKSIAALVGKGYASRAALEQGLRRNHLTNAIVVTYIETQLALNAVVTHLVKQRPISPAAIKSFYEAHITQFEAPAAYEVRVIVVPTKRQAETILHQVLAARGKNFGSLAEQDSIDTATAPERGDLGWVTLAQLAGGAAAAVHAMKVGEFAVADTSNGYDVLELVATRRPGRQSLAAASVPITRALINQGLQAATKQYLSELTKQAQIRVLWHPAAAGTQAPQSTPGSGTATKG